MLLMKLDTARVAASYGIEAANIDRPLLRENATLTLVRVASAEWHLRTSTL